MSLDLELFLEFRERLVDKYTAEELCELLGLTAEDIIDAFEEKVLELRDLDE